MTSTPRRGSATASESVAFVLPPGLSGLLARPLAPEDAPLVVALHRAAEGEVLTEPLTELADVRAMWRAPGFDLARDSIGVFDGHRLVADATTDPRGHTEVAVAPDQRGQGLGTALLGWVRRRLAGSAATTIEQTVPARSPAATFLTAVGARASYEAWILDLPADRRMPTQPLPGSHTLGPADDAELTTVHRVVEDAFDWPGRHPRSYEHWAAEFLEDPDAATWQRRVVRDPSGDVVGAVVVTAAEDGTAWVHQLAVRADRRGLGLGRALLADALAEGRRRGLVGAGLSTDSRTGALALYEHLGMEVTATFQHFVLEG